MTSQASEVRLAPLATYQKAAVFNPYEHFCMYAGTGSGKTFCGAHWSINNRIERPGNKFLIGANNYDQLSQATLAEMFYWLQEYGFEFVQDRKPPTHFGSVPSQKKYHNTLTVYDPRSGKASLGYTRILSNPDAIRGIEFEDYWIDELRDTTQYAHDVLLSRQRGYDNPRGFCSTTTNGDSWDKKRFVDSARKESLLYGSMHITIDDAIRAGVLTAKYKDTLMASYTELMVQQELYAKHVNVLGSRAYYAASDKNKAYRAPWGDRYPSEHRPLIVGCDFNFQPAPCVWIVGQLSPDGDRIHWYREIASVETSTESMTMMLMNQFPNFFYRIYGDASGNRGTTSNAGETDYNKIAKVLAENGCLFSIDVDQSNPLVKNRVENMNSLYYNALGEMRQTYDPQGCPLLDSDNTMVGWKLTILRGQGRLDDGGDKQRTHSSDAAGYAVYKLFPPGIRAPLIDSNISIVKQSIIDDVNGLVGMDRMMQ